MVCEWPRLGIGSAPGHVSRSGKRTAAVVAVLASFVAVVVMLAGSGVSDAVLRALSLGGETGR
jgi:hypothetical protein